MQILNLDAVLGRPVKRHLGNLVVRHRNLEAIAKGLELLEAHLLLLMGNVHALAGGAHPVALDGFGEDDRGLIAMGHGLGVSGIDFDRVVSAAAELPDFVVGHAGDHLEQLRVLGEELLAYVGAVARLESSGIRRRRIPPCACAAVRACRARARRPSCCPR